MSNSTRTLIDYPGRVFVTSDFGQSWTAGSSEKGFFFEGQSCPINQALVEFSFVLPPLQSHLPGCYPIFGLACGEDAGGVFLQVHYEPSKELIHCGMGRHWVSLGPVPTEDYSRRVLRAFILIAPGGLFPSIEDAVTGQAELFGELRLPQNTQSRASAAYGLPPWNVAPNGPWWITSGCAIQSDQGMKTFPSGFGLSDLRIHLADPSEDDVATAAYSGALDHLVVNSEITNRWSDLEDWPELDGHEEPLSDVLQGFADQLTALSGEVTEWAGRALNLAGDTEGWAFRLAEEAEKAEAETERDRDFDDHDVYVD